MHIQQQPASLPPAGSASGIAKGQAEASTLRGTSQWASCPISHHEFCCCALKEQLLVFDCLKTKTGATHPSVTSSCMYLHPNACPMAPCGVSSDFMRSYTVVGRWPKMRQRPGGGHCKHSRPKPQAKSCVPWCIEKVGSCASGIDYLPYTLRTSVPVCL